MVFQPFVKKGGHVMNTLTRWEPLRKLDELQNRLATLLGRHPIRKNDEKKEALTVAE